MNKAELISAIATDAGVSKSVASKVLDSMINNVTESLKKGKKVTLVGFGTFSVTKRKARTGRNPQTGKEIKIPARKVAKFRAGAKLAEAVK